MALTPVLIDANTKRAQIHKRAIEGVQNVFPFVAGDEHTFDVENLNVDERTYSSRQQKDAMMRGRTLQEPLRGDIVIRNKKGKVVDRQKNAVLAQLPFFTPRHTFIVDGNEYSVPHQKRIRPGVYTRVRGNDELEAAFNLGKGENFRVHMNPEKGHLFMQYGSTNIPLYPVLKRLGVPTSQLQRAWGKGVVDVNRDAFAAKDVAAVDKLYARLTPEHRLADAQTTEERIASIRESYEHTSLEPEVTQRTLGKAYDRVTPNVLVDASKKLLDVHRKGIDVDDRDNLAVQTLHGVDDFIRERIELEGRNLTRKVRMKARGSAAPRVAEVVPPSPFTRSVRNFVTTSSLASIGAQINPIEMIDSAMRVTSLGEGGIGSERAVPDEARRLHHTHFGVLDPARTPESFRAGIDLRAALWTSKDEKGRIHTKMHDVRKGKLRDVPVDTLEGSTIAFHGEGKKRYGVSAMRKGELVSVPRSQVDYAVPHANFLYSPATTLVPFIESSQGNRVLMGGKMATQALPLLEREEPYIQAESYNQGRTMEQEMAQLVVPTSPVNGEVAKVDQDYIYIRPNGTKTGSSELELAPIEHAWTAKEGSECCDVCSSSATTRVLWAEGHGYIPACEKHKEEIAESKGDDFSGFKPFPHDKQASGATLVRVPYDTDYPLSSKTRLHNTVTVKKGDKVRTNQHLAESNFTRNGRMALGRNMNVGYLAYYGLNTNDAVVVSETAAQKLTSEHMYKEALALDTDITLNKKKHRMIYGTRWTAAQYDNLDNQGIAKPGATVHPGDPIILALRKAAPSPEQQMLGRLHKTLATPFREQAVTWDHKSPGTIAEVVATGTRILVTVKTNEPASIGDKLAGRYGNKGVISHILPDDVMVQTPDGKPLDILMPPTGVNSRVNPAQVLETALAKVARKTGEPIAVGPSSQNNVTMVRAALKKHGLTDKEVLFNPRTGKHIKGPDGRGVMVGPQYTYKLAKSTDTNYSARGIDSYDVNQQPSKGGSDGAKALGRMEMNALLSHNARNVVKESATVKSSHNDEFWRAYQLGQPLPALQEPFVAKKFTAMLQGAGIRVDKGDEQVTLGPLTDPDITRLSSGRVEKPTMLRERDLAPEKGGLFDPVVTGGSQGERWSHINLSEPIVNPSFADPVRRMLGMTVKQYRATIGTEGGRGIQSRLAGLNMRQREQDLIATTRTATGANLDNAVKQLKAVRALRKEGLTPDKAYVLSKVPVVPPTVRPILPSRGGRDMLIADANYLYRDTMLANDALRDAKKVLPDEAIGDARRHLHDAVGATFGLNDPVSPSIKARGAKGFITTIAGQGSPKRGFFHSRVMYRPQDLSGRGTVAPDLTLNMDEIGVPEEMLWTTYGPHIVRRLVQNGYPAMQAKEMIEQRHPSAKNALDAEIKERPVFVNRAPTLHRHGMIGAYPIPVPGKTIRVNPFMEKGMNMDYDGDTLQLHVPVLHEAVQEVKGMTLSNLLFGDRTKSDLLIFPQHEAVLGIHMGTQPGKGRAKKFKSPGEAIKAFNKGDLDLMDSVLID